MWSNQENRVRKQVKNPCEAYKIKASQILHKIISTHPLTWLIISAIVQLEQRRRDKRKRKVPKISNPDAQAINTSDSPNVQKIYLITERSNDL